MGTAILEKELSAPAKLVYIALSELVDEEGNVIVTRAELKRLTGYKCKNSIRSGLVELENEGLIEISKRDVNGYSLANNYRLLQEAV